MNKIYPTQRLQAYHNRYNRSCTILMQFRVFREELEMNYKKSNGARFCFDDKQNSSVLVHQDSEEMQPPVNGVNAVDGGLNMKT